MNTILKLAVAVLPSLLASAASRGQDAGHAFRPPAVPLVACDPYFSIWSTDQLAAGPTHHWTGHAQPLSSLVRVDGKSFRLMGDAPSSVEAMKQVRLDVTPTRSTYAFEGAGVQVVLAFMTPLLPDDLLVCAQPITYVTWTVAATDGASHDVDVSLGASANLAVNTDDQDVVFAGGSLPGLRTLRVGTVDQPVLQSTGDDRRIDWGYFYVAVPTDGTPNGTTLGLAAPDAKDAFAAPAEDLKFEGPADKAPALAASIKLGAVTGTPVSAHAILAYDDLRSIRYFNADLRPYWAKDGTTFSDLLQSAEKNYADLTKRCAAFDAELMGDLRKIGGESYVQLGVLAWRQALAAQKLCADANGQPLMFSKENFSNGCISTVDVLYPAAPQMLAFAPSMLKASLVPLMDYSASPRWKHDSAPHDLGQYPHATGQVYGGGEDAIAMPVEECGNMLILLGALAKTEGNAEFSRKYWPTITKWKDYLVAKGLDPENQLCTDDFAGHIARNANLSAKAVMGIASYGLLADMLGNKDEAEKAKATAKDYAQKWVELGKDGDHSQLVFGAKGKGTWSQKYNIAWDTILGTDVFPPEVAYNEVAYYKTKMNKYGLPLDSREAYTKLDWEVWTATLAVKHEDFQMIIDACAKWANETPSRVPLSDWYWTNNDGKQRGFQARSVVGGLFIPFLKDKDLWQKYASRDKANPANWAAPDFTPPVLRPLAPNAAAVADAPTWRYSTAPAPDGWMKPEFDDAAWATGKAGFGQEGTRNAKVGTSWTTDHILLRREFELPADGVTEPRLQVWHDDEIEVYLNGVLAYRARESVDRYHIVRLSARARAALKPGKNILAVRCGQFGGGQFVDVGLVDVVPASPSSGKK